MKKALFILLPFLFFAGSFPVKGQDTLTQAKEEIQSVESLPYNTQTYSQFKKQHFYDYYRIQIEKKSLIQELYEQFDRWLNRLFQKSISRKGFNTLLWIVGGILLLTFGIILYLNNPGLFYFNRKKSFTYSLEEDTIENQDLDYLMEYALKEHRFSDAIRWQYLKTLKILHDRDCISYDVHKTVNEYVYEIKDLALRKPFRNLSSEFVYYRYGKGEADAERFAQFRSAAETVQKMQAR